MRRGAGIAVVSTVVLSALLAAAGESRGQDRSAGQNRTVEPDGEEVFRAQNELKKEDPRDPVRRDSASHMYTFFMRKGQKYIIQCDSKEIDSYLRLEDAKGKQLAEDDDGAGYPNARIVFTCPQSDTYRIFVTSYGKEAEGKEFGNYGKYILTIRMPLPPLVLQDGKVQIQGRLTDKDPTLGRGRAYKAYTIKLQADKVYQIDMISNAFDTYLILEDAQGQRVAEDDDSGGNLNARIVFNCRRTGLYRILCTSFAPRAGGPFVLRVQEQ